MIAANWVNTKATLKYLENFTSNSVENDISAVRRIHFPALLTCDKALYHTLKAAGTGFFLGVSFQIIWRLPFHAIWRMTQRFQALGQLAPKPRTNGCFFPAFAISVGNATTNKLTHTLDHDGNCAFGVDLEISSSSGVMSAGTLANKGVLR